MTFIAHAAPKWACLPSGYIGNFTIISPIRRIIVPGAGRRPSDVLRPGVVSGGLRYENPGMMGKDAVAHYGAIKYGCGFI